jgi:hypothetical protein
VNLAGEESWRSLNLQSGLIWSVVKPEVFLMDKTWLVNLVRRSVHLK